MTFLRRIFGKADKVVDRRFRAPDGMLLYAIGDVHGRADLLLTLMKKIKEDIKSRTDFSSVKVIFLGDYVDRGFHSREVIDLLLKLHSAAMDFIFLAGNHEDMMLKFLTDPADSKLWLDVGGMATLVSYGVFLPENPELDTLEQASSDLAKKLPAAHKVFLEQLPEYVEYGDYIFVHAGLRPGIPVQAQRREDMLAIRQDFTESRFDFGKCIVHGHSGVRQPKFFGNRIAIDTGAFATGCLTAVRLQNDQISFLST